MTAYTVATGIEGILRKPVGGNPIPEGIRLYRSLSEFFSVVLLAGPDFDWEEWSDFVITERLSSHDQVIDWPLLGDSDAERRLRQVNSVRLSGYALAFVIDTDPEACALMLGKGFNTVLFTHAAYAHPDWRPDTARQPKPWDELAKQVADNARLRAGDRRMDEEIV